MIELRWVTTTHGLVLQYRYRKPDLTDDITMYLMKWNWSEWLNVEIDEYGSIPCNHMK